MAGRPQACSLSSSPLPTSHSFHSHSHHLLQRRVGAPLVLQLPQAVSVAPRKLLHPPPLRRLQRLATLALQAPLRRLGLGGGGRKGGAPCVLGGLDLGQLDLLL